MRMCTKDQCVAERSVQDDKDVKEEHRATKRFEKENKLEGVVQKKNCPYYSDYLWIVKA